MPTACWRQRCLIGIGRGAWGVCRALGGNMKSIHFGAVATLVMSSMLVVPASSQQSDCTQVEGAQPVCGLKPHQIDGLKSLLQTFDSQNQPPNAVVPNAVGSCVTVDHFKPVCGLTAPQLSEVGQQIDAFKSQNAK